MCSLSYSNKRIYIYNLLDEYSTYFALFIEVLARGKRDLIHAGTVVTFGPFFLTTEAVLVILELSFRVWPARTDYQYRP